MRTAALDMLVGLEDREMRGRRLTLGQGMVHPRYSCPKMAKILSHTRQVCAGLLAKPQTLLMGAPTIHSRNWGSLVGTKLATRPTTAERILVWARDYSNKKTTSSQAKPSTYRSAAMKESSSNPKGENWVDSLAKKAQIPQTPSTPSPQTFNVVESTAAHNQNQSISQLKDLKEHSSSKEQAPTAPPSAPPTHAANMSISVDGSANSIGAPTKESKPLPNSSPAAVENSNQAGPDVVKSSSVTQETSDAASDNNSTQQKEEPLTEKEIFEQAKKVNWQST